VAFLWKDVRDLDLSCLAVDKLDLFINLTAANLEFCRFFLHPRREGVFGGHIQLRRIITHILRDFHRTEMRPTHGAEMRDFHGLFRQSFIMERSCRIRVKR